MRAGHALGLPASGVRDEHELPGFPVFWEREGDNSRPFGTDLGSFSSSDTLLLVFEGARYGMPLPEFSPQREAAVRRAWDQLLRGSVERPGDWHDGAVAFDMFDDDFVGAFMKTHAERGSCPRSTRRPSACTR